MDNKEPKKLLYIAYGSNINLWQMALRCPHSRPLDPAMLKGWELEFRGYANIVPNKDAEVPSCCGSWIRGISLDLITMKNFRIATTKKMWRLILMVKSA